VANARPRDASYTTYTGYLKNATYDSPYYGSVNVSDELSGKPGEPPKISVGSECSGFIANPDGHVVTAGHCVDDAEGKQAIINQAIDKALNMGMNPSEAPGMLNYGLKHWKVERQKADSAIDRLVQVVPTGIVNARPLKAEVTEPIVPFNKGDVALLKVDAPAGQPLPALEVASGSTPASGTPVTASGYPGTVTAINAQISQGMSGGPVVNAEGQVVGVVSWKHAPRRRRSTSCPTSATCAPSWPGTT
jgi:S1-C subfamily serine protease